MEDSYRAAALTTFVTGTRLMSIWLLAYYGYHYAQREINATKESARLALIAKEAQLNNLTAQLNPHFFFNSLNNIKALVMEDPQTARRAIDQVDAQLVHTPILPLSIQNRTIKRTTGNSRQVYRAAHSPHQ